MSKAQELIDSVLRESDMESSLKEFFLSRRPALIYGAGNQGSILRDFCKIFRKKVLGFLVSPGGNSLSACGVTDECHSLDEIPRGWVSGDVDCIIALGEQHREKVANALRQAGMPHIIQVKDWEKENKELVAVRNAFFANIEVFSCMRSLNIVEDAIRSKRIFIHVGMPKCGSTTIQKFLCNNREVLREHDYFYPESLTGSEQHVELLHNNSEMFFSEILKPTDLYIEDVFFSKYKNIIFSAEMFVAYWERLPDFLKKYGEYICYLRTPLSHAQSSILQGTIDFIWGRPGASYTNFQDIYWHAAFQRANLEKFFSSGTTRSRTHLRSFDLAVQGKGLCEDFLDIIGLQTDVSDFVPAPIENSGLSAPYLFFLWHVSQLPLSQDPLRQIGHECYVLSAQDKRFPRYRFFSRRQIAEIPVELIHWYEALGKEMGDPDFWSRGEEALLKLEQCPYDQLPEDLQYDIFERLSAQSQKAILDVWPLRREIPDKLWGSAFLPDIPTTKAQAEFMRGWMRAHRPVRV